MNGETVRIDHQKIRKIAIEDGVRFKSKFTPTQLLYTATFSIQVLAVQQAGQNYPNAMQQAAHVMAAEGCVAWGICWSAVTARVKPGFIPCRAAWDRVLGHGLLRDGSTPVCPFGGYLI
jgi:hypothetical protein